MIANVSSLSSLPPPPSTLPMPPSNQQSQVVVESANQVQVPSQNKVNGRPYVQGNAQAQTQSITKGQSLNQNLGHNQFQNVQYSTQNQNSQRDGQKDTRREKEKEKEKERDNHDEKQKKSQIVSQSQSQSQSQRILKNDSQIKSNNNQSFSANSQNSISGVKYEKDINKIDNKNKINYTNTNTNNNNIVVNNTSSNNSSNRYINNNTNYNNNNTNNSNNNSYIGNTNTNNNGVITNIAAAIEEVTRTEKEKKIALKSMKANAKEFHPVSISSSSSSSSSSLPQPDHEEKNYYNLKDINNKDVSIINNQNNNNQHDSYENSTNISMSTFKDGDHNGISYQTDTTRNVTYTSTYDTVQIPRYTQVPVYDSLLSQQQQQQQQQLNYSGIARTHSTHYDNNNNNNNNNGIFTDNNNYMEGYVQRGVMYGIDDRQVPNMNIGVGTGHRHQVLLGPSSILSPLGNISVEQMTSVDRNVSIPIVGTTYYDKGGIAYYKQENNTIQNMSTRNNININNIINSNNNMNMNGTYTDGNGNVQYLSNYNNIDGFNYSGIGIDNNDYLGQRQNIIINNDGIAINVNNVGYDDINMIDRYYNNVDENILQQQQQQQQQQSGSNSNNNNINNNSSININNSIMNSTQYYQNQTALIPYNNYISLVPIPHPTQLPIQIQENVKIKSLDLDGKAKPFSPSSTATIISSAPIIINDNNTNTTTTATTTTNNNDNNMINNDINNNNNSKKEVVCSAIPTAMGKNEIDDDKIRRSDSGNESKSMYEKGIIQDRARGEEKEVTEEINESSKKNENIEIVNDNENVKKVITISSDKNSQNNNNSNSNSNSNNDSNTHR